jgi:predicted RNase H-like HicB family nuclease
MYYAAKVKHSKDWWEVTFPDRPDIHTCGTSLEQALEMAEDALNSMLKFDLEKKRKLIEPKIKANPKKSLYAVQVDPCLEVSYMLFGTDKRRSMYSISISDNITKKCNPTLQTLKKVANTLGKKLEIRLV